VRRLSVPSSELHFDFCIFPWRSFLFAEDDKMPILPRLLFWFWVMFAVYAAMRLTQGDDGGNFHLVSWNEFYHEMLAKGAAACSDPFGIPWLTPSSEIGVTAGGDFDSVNVTFDSSGMSPGTYTGNLCVHSNDPDPGPGNGTDLVVIVFRWRYGSSYDSSHPDHHNGHLGTIWMGRR